MRWGRSQEFKNSRRRELPLLEFLDSWLLEFVDRTEWREEKKLGRFIPRGLARGFNPKHVELCPATAEVEDELEYDYD